MKHLIKYPLFAIFRTVLAAITITCTTTNATIYLATGSVDKTVKIWDVQNNFKQIKTIQHKSWVTSVAFSPDNRFLATGSGDKTVKIWDVKNNFEQIQTIQHNDYVNSVAFSLKLETKRQEKFREKRLLREQKKRRRTDVIIKTQ